MTNQDRMKRSDIIISNEWDTEQTVQQVKHLGRRHCYLSRSILFPFAIVVCFLSTYILLISQTTITSFSSQQISIMFSWSHYSFLTQVRKALQGVKNRMSSNPPLQVQQDFNGNNFLSSRWFSCCRSLKVDEDTQRRWWRLMRQKYSGVGRYYHNTHHLRDMFVLLQELAISADRQDLLYLAIFFHDVVYDATRTVRCDGGWWRFLKLVQDNEEASVKFFQTFCNAARQISQEDQVKMIGKPHVHVVVMRNEEWSCTCCVDERSRRILKWCLDFRILFVTWSCQRNTTLITTGN